MKLERLALRGFSPAFAGVVDLPLRDLDPGLIAIVGENGAGKTTLLESVPGTIYRQMPSNDGADPVTYATGRDSYLEQEFSFAGVGTFRARLNLDGIKRQTDAVLEQVLPDGSRVPLNDGKRSTFDEAIKSRFPSFDLFINSSFAAQGRGDEFTRRKPSARKDLFAEFLGQQHYAVMAKAAGEAVDLAADAKLRLEVQIETIERDTARVILDEIQRQAIILLASGDDAERRQRELEPAIADLETRLALLSDQVVANAAAADRLRHLEAELARRRTEFTTVDGQRQQVSRSWQVEQDRIVRDRDAAVTEIEKRIGGNQQILGLAAQITEAVSGVAHVDAELTRLRSELAERHAEHAQAQRDHRAIDKAIAALVPIAQHVDRATRDASLLGTVPCGGVGEYAACDFLRDATAARDQLEGLRAQLEPKASLVDRLNVALNEEERLTASVVTIQGQIAASDVLRVGYQKHAQYQAPLAEAKAKIAGYEEARDKAKQDAERAADDAKRRHDARLLELDHQADALRSQIDAGAEDVARASADLKATASGNSEASRLQVALTSARSERDVVIATVAATANSRQELERRRQEIDAKRLRLTDLRDRLTRIETELLEWRDLVKAFSKGGLPDLEIDAAGPTISALANELLLSCFGARFTLELVTQVAKADGGGMKDNFTVFVTDNETGGDPRDIRAFSGGQRTILQEGLMCAIAAFVNERSPMPIRTLWRDETGAALDPENAVRYVAMLRRVQEVGGYHHVFYITHSREAAALADAQIQVGGGTARIALPPFEVAA